jgi:REP element-mobilizing transposase RayT
MARIPRHWILEKDSFFHVTWQCHNKSWLLKPHWAKKILYSLLLKYKDRYGMTFYSYIIMDNHLHISGKAPDLVKFSAFFRIVNGMFAKEVNKRLKRCGQVIRDRFKSPQLQNEMALIQEMIYHDLNEVRAGKAQHPNENELSSYPYYAFGAPDPLLTEPEFYRNLGITKKKRQLAYQSMVMEILVAAPRKRNGQYTTQLFIGDPQWVKTRFEELKEIEKALNQPGPLRSLSPPSRKKNVNFES